MGGPADDFLGEFLSYWALSRGREGVRFYLLDPVDALGPKPAVALLGDKVVIGRSRERVTRWAQNSASESPGFLAEGQYLVLYRDRPLLPREYPADLCQLRALLRSEPGTLGDRLDAHLLSSAGPIALLIVQTIGEGQTLAGILTQGLSLARDSKLRKGFRPGKTPPEILFARAELRMQKATYMRCDVQRADPQWLHSRGGSGEDLSEKRVVIIGCGSIGGYVAHLLARAGVGQISLVDPDSLSWDNVGRHVLGADDVGRPKAEALAANLLHQLPHLSITPVSEDWRDWLRRDNDAFDGAHLVVSTAGTWSCDQPLNLLARRSALPPVLFGWLETYALAGHALLVAPGGGCLECGMNPFGRFGNEVVHFAEPQLAKEPGGCTYYQQYGPVQMMPVVSLITRAALTALVSPPEESTWSTFVAGEPEIRERGGSLSDAWTGRIPPGVVHFTVEKAWQKNPSCRVCNP